MSLLSGEMTVEQRAAVIDRYRNGKEKVLVTTNVCSRGGSDATIQANTPAECLKLIAQVMHLC